MDIFEYASRKRIKEEAPLAARLRPRTLEEFMGQKHILSPGSHLYRSIKADRLSSVIFYGPSGTGKTTLAMVIANATAADFKQINATVSGKKEMVDIVENAKIVRSGYGRKTILFVDEIHRFNKAQQDYLLPFVEDGTIILIGATTENPYFEVNRALISRSTIYELKPLDASDIKQIIYTAVYDKERGMGAYNAVIDEDAADFLADFSGGDARTALNAIELAVLTTPVSQEIPADARMKPDTVNAAVLQEAPADARMKPGTVNAAVSQEAPADVRMKPDAFNAAGEENRDGSSEPEGKRSTQIELAISEKQKSEPQLSTGWQQENSRTPGLRKSEQPNSTGYRQEDGPTPGQQTPMPTVSGKGCIHLTKEVLAECIQKKNVRYDKDGDNHYDTISAFIKSMRGSDPDAAVYYLAKMIYAGEDVNFIARRIMICAAEDVGCADPRALQVAVAAQQAVHVLGMPEARIPLAEAVIYVAGAPKSNSAIMAIDKALALVESTDVKGVPPHLQDAHYKGAASLGHGLDYKYAHAFPEHYVKQQYLPDELKDVRIYEPGSLGYEKNMKERLERLRAREE